MRDDKLVAYEELSSLCARLQLAMSGSELHGSLCGFLACGGHIDHSPLAVLHIQSEENTLGARDQSMLALLVQQSINTLAADELIFQLLIPADDRPLSERVEALGDWCRGFLGGFGLAGSPAHARLSKEAQEILHDLGLLAAATFGLGDDEEDEESFIELHEFVRMGTMLLHAECVLGRNRPTDNTVH